MIKNDHFLLILGQKHDFLKHPIRRLIFTLFLGYFWSDVNSKKFKKHYISTKLDRGYRLVYKLSYMDKKNILLYFYYKGDPYQKLYSLSNSNFMIYLPKIRPNSTKKTSI